MESEIETLRAHVNALHVAWNAARTDWRDAVAVRFERDHWNELERAASQLLVQCDAFDQLLDRAECQVRELN